MGFFRRFDPLARPLPSRGYIVLIGYTHCASFGLTSKKDSTKA